jgi:hypothetical protein
MSAALEAAVGRSQGRHVRAGQRRNEERLMKDGCILGKLLLSGCMLLGLAGAGCQVLPDEGLAGPASEVILRGFDFAPRVRYGAYPSAIVGTPFVGGHLGNHGYYFRPSEKNGIVYTCRGGHIDTMHLRIASDWTAYLVAESYRHLMRGDRGFSYKLFVDHSRSYVNLTYPENWKTLSQEQRREIASEVAFALGPYLTYTMVTWHEILTWYGYKCIGLPAEFASAFSWEDSYSNLLGTIVAARALRDTERSYNEAMRLALNEELQKLGVQSAAVARRASESVKGQWYTGDVVMFVDMRKRNFDIGLDDGLVTPTLVPNVPGCEGADPLSYPVPTLEVLSKHGFHAALEIEPHEWEKNKILRIVHPNKRGKRVRPADHLPQIMAHIRQEAAARYGGEYAAD